MSNPFAEKALLPVDTLWNAEAFVESIKTKVFNEADSIYLESIHFGSKFYPLGFSALNNRADTTPVNGDNPFPDFSAIKPDGLLL